MEPKYQINIGYIARVSKNFGIGQLHFVKPRAKLTGKKAIMFSKHASQLLKNAKTYNSISEAAKDCSILIGTTGIWRKANRTFNRLLLLPEAAQRLKKPGAGSTAGILIGRDDTGLTSEELSGCDMVLFIGTDAGYPVLNISHALSIILYELTKQKLRPMYGGISGRNADRKEQEHLFMLFNSSLEKKRIRNKKAVGSAFRRIVRASQPNSAEIHALITALKK